MYINDFFAGQSFSEKTQASIEINKKIAEVCGDYNSIHFDDESAKKVGFKGIVAHALFCEGIISKIIGCDLPGNGTIIAEQKIKCKKPVYMGDVITTKVTIVGIDSERKRIEILAECFNQYDEVVMSAEVKSVFRELEANK